MSSNEQLAKLYSLAQGTSDVTLTPDPPKRSVNYPWQGWVEKRAADAIYKEVGQNLVKAFDTQVREKAALQGTVVNESADAFMVYSGIHPGVVEPTGITFNLLRTMAKRCEPVAAIHGTWIRFVTAYCRRPEMKWGYAQRPGLRVKLRIPSQKATDEDVVRMEELTEYILNCGFTAPPKKERPLNWKPGLVHFASCAIRDSLTLDGVFVRTWPSANSEVPVVCFATEDAGRIRKVVPEVRGVKNHVQVTEAWRGERTNTRGEDIEHVKLTRDGLIEQEYTAKNGMYFIRNPRTDEDVNGYGFSELESAINAITIWMSAKEYNASRFQKDSLPRGILSILGNLNEQQFQSFRLHWQQLMSGEGKRWFNPILKGTAQTGSAVNWLPIDMSSRDMEYHQFMFAVALWIHSLYGISPEETGYEALSPFRPPLSEASPESKMQSSQDKGFEPLLRWFEGLLNEILWTLDPSKKYMVEFQGVGQGDEEADTEMFGAMLQTGQITPRMVLDMRDIPIPKNLEKDECMDMLGTWAANHTLLMQMDAQQQQQEMAEQQQAQAQQQQQQEGQLSKMQAFQSMNQQGMQTPDGGGPPGMAPEQEEPEPPNFQRPTALQKALLFPYGDMPGVPTRHWLDGPSRPPFAPKPQKYVRVLFAKKTLFR